MTQNIYDNDEFFENYGQLRRSLEGLDGAQEWPVMRSMLPELKGADGGAGRVMAEPGGGSDTPAVPAGCGEAVAKAAKLVQA